MKKFAAVFFFLILALSLAAGIFLLFSGQTVIRGRAEDFERSLLETSPVSNAAAFLLRRAALPGTEVIRGKNGVLFWQPELAAAAAASRLEENLPRIQEISALLSGRRGTFLLPIPLRSWCMREELPFAVPDELPPHADGRVLNELLPGVDVLPLEDLFEDMRRSGEKVFLSSDNHWTAKAVVAAVLLTGGKLGLKPRQYSLRTENIAGYGNLARLAGIAGMENAVVFIPETTDSDGQVEEEPQILLCGDSFFNIYSLETSGFGTKCGFPDLLEALFCCRVVSVSVDGGGEKGSRSLLPQLGINTMDYDFVIWEFPVYELQRSGWELAPQTAAPVHQRINIAGGEKMEGLVLAAAPAAPAGTPNDLYPYVLTELLVEITSGENVILCVPARSGNIEHIVPRAGERISFEAVAADDGAGVYGGMARNTLQEEEFVVRPFIWGEHVQILPPVHRQ